MLNELLLKNRIIVCTGTGGVGKTTTAAALAVYAAQLGRRCLVLTIDPSRRLATSLGLDLTSVEERSVPLQASGSLTAAVIKSKETFDEFILKNSENEEIAKKILKNPLYQQLATTLSGSQEFTSLERLLLAHESQKYDLIILDTPPAQHAIDFLQAPRKISNLFDESITKWFFSERETPSFWGQVLGKGTRTVFKVLESLTGSQFIVELTDFFSHVRGLQRTIRERSLKAESLLAHPDTQFILVTSFNPAKLNEALMLKADLEKMQLHLGCVIINRAFPIWLQNALTQEASQSGAHPFYLEFVNYYKERYDLYTEFKKALKKKLPILQIPEYNIDIQGLQDLQMFAQHVSQSDAEL